MENDSAEKQTGFFKKNPVLKIKEFRSYLAVRFGLIFALNMQITIIFYWVYHITSNKLALGGVGLSEVIPAITFSFFAGHFVDLNEKRKMVLLCLASYILLGASLFTLTTPFALDNLGVDYTLYLVYFFVFCGGAIRSFMGPSMFSLFGLVVPRKHYANATSWSSMAWQTGSVLGPLAAGVLIALDGITLGMGVVVAIELLLLIPMLSVGVKPILKKEKEPILQSLTQGIRFVLKTPELLGAQLLDMFSVLFGGAVALLPVYQKEILMVDEVGYGILRAAPGIGALITLGILAFLPLRTNPGKKLFVAVGGFAISIIIFGISKNFILSFAMLMLSGMFDAVSVVIRSTILQLVTPDHMRGRVASVNTMFVSSSNELGDFESGVMAHWLGTVRAVVVGGCLTLGVVAVTFFSAPQLRRFGFYEEEKQDEQKEE
ncbi:MFS transporter [Flavobacterium alkalisoli]|uniref:Multidrug efflux pump Tap n=2 Tax=Flavobacterium TaxID=237 RepID=A0A444WID6_9FLAO|nr:MULTISPECIES: MFS transporter [Flavobacterium]QEE49366.1 MFS transporter [Flavobacterium alkalisoli]RYJ45494.1 Major facilitator superfamily permease [Flavobacterium beibuense]